MHIENNHIKGYRPQMTITQIDFSILDWIQNTLKNPVLDVVMPVITHLGDGGFIWILLTLILIVIPRTRKTGILIGISLAAGAIAYLLILKPIIARPRPFTQNPAAVLLIKPPSDFSFPSGHTACAFSAVAVLFFRQNRLWIPAVILAAAIAFSRMYLYVHFPTDVLAGIIIGTGVSAAVCFIKPKETLNKSY